MRWMDDQIRRVLVASARYDARALPNGAFFFSVLVARGFHLLAPYTRLLITFVRKINILKIHKYWDEKYCNGSTEFIQSALYCFSGSIGMATSAYSSSPSWLGLPHSYTNSHAQPVLVPPTLYFSGFYSKL